MERTVIGLFCVVLVVRLTFGSPVFYERPTVMNKVEFSDRDIDSDRIDPLIEQSEEEDGRSNEAVNTRTDMNGVGENGDSKDITSVTEIITNEPTATLANEQDMPTEQQQQHNVNGKKDNSSTDEEHGSEMTTAAVIPKDETPPDLKPTSPSLYDNGTKGLNNSESSDVEVSRNATVSDTEVTTNLVPTESSGKVTQTALPTEGQNETAQSVTTTVSETITNALELTSSLIVPAVTDWIRAYSTNEVTDSAEEVTQASSSSPTEEPISTMKIKEEATSLTLTATEEILLPSIDTNGIDTSDTMQSSIEVTTEDSKTSFSSSTVSIVVSGEPEETLLETTTTTLEAVTESEISETTMMTPTSTVVETSDREEESATEASTPEVFSQLSDMTTQMQREYTDTDQPVTDSETIEAATTTSLMATTTGATQEENNDDATLISSTESIVSSTVIEEDNVSKDYTTVGSEISTSTLLVTIEPESSTLTEGDYSTTDTPRLTTTEAADGFDTTVLITESSTSISHEAVDDSSAAPVTESQSTFLSTTEENDFQTTSKYSNTDSIASADETSARSNNGSNPNTSAEDQYSTLESFTLPTDIPTAAIAQSSTEIATSSEDQQSTTWSSSSVLAIESTPEATTIDSSIYSTTETVTLPEDEYTTVKIKQLVENAEDPDTTTSRIIASSEDVNWTTASLLKLTTDITTPDLPISAEEQYTTFVSAEDTVDSTTLVESNYTDADSSKLTEDQHLAVTDRYDTTISTTTVMSKTEDYVEIATFTNAPIETTMSTEPDELKTNTLLASVETNDATDDTATIPLTQGATTFTSSSEEVDTVTATLAAHSSTTSMSEIVEDIATVATVEEMTTEMDLIEESTTTSAFPSTLVSTLNSSAAKEIDETSLSTEDDSGLYTTIDNNYQNKVTTVSSHDEDMKTEETTTELFTTVSTPYEETINDMKVSIENMPRTATSGQTNPTSTDTPEEIPNTEPPNTPAILNQTTSPIGPVSVYVTEPGVMEITLDKSTEELANLDDTDATFAFRSAGSNSLSPTTLLSMTLVTTTASPENVSAASDRTTALNMYSHSIATVETIDPSTSMSVNEEEFPSTSFSLMTPENGAASLPTTTILCFAATLTVLAISDNLRLHRRY